MKPDLKRELVIKWCPAPEVLSIHIATPRAIHWIKNEACRYTSEGFTLSDIEKRKLPFWMTLTVSPCFDIKEVKTYLENPDYDTASIASIG